MGKLDGRVACITGGTRSIGRGMAEAFLREGAKVVVNGRDPEKGAAAVAEMGGGDNVAFFAGDSSKQDVVEGLIDFTIAHFGQLDICCLNSGGVKNALPLHLMTDEEWNLEIDWNLNHVFWGMRRAVNHMLPRGYGRILVTSSVEGKAGKPGLCGYNTTKHAVNGLVKSAAKELSTTGITVNSLLPGLVETDIVRETGPATAQVMGTTYEGMLEMFSADSCIKRTNTVEEVAAVALMLATEEARNFTGCMFPIDGGSLPY